jgi:hypothetical protein
MRSWRPAFREAFFPASVPETGSDGIGHSTLPWVPNGT